MAYVLCMYVFFNIFLLIILYVYLCRLGYITLCTLITYFSFFFINFEIVMFLIGNKMPCDKLFLLEVVRFSLYHQNVPSIWVELIDMP